MTKKLKQIGTDADSQLQALGIRYKGFEHYESDVLVIQGTPNDPDYRWKLTFKRTARAVGCSSLPDVIQKIKHALAPDLAAATPPPPKLSWTAPAGNAKAPARQRKKDNPDQYGLGIQESDI
jgi:hypothetical protein